MHKKHCDMVTSTSIYIYLYLMLDYVCIYVCWVVELENLNGEHKLTAIRRC